ncbi:pirin family protein [Hafnia paralvei]|uniref:pirin family protein n=1 Tax=Hafnia paralvei TaxID=546367 RepID=UPI00300DA85F
MKKIIGVYSAPGSHWVGDGFPVRSLFSYNQQGEYISPFLLLDYAGPQRFSATDKRRGVGEHPHRGFETVTIVYQGELEHRDSTGNGGFIDAGDVQWMTAGAGILHEEFHAPSFAATGGTLEMVQLWVNLPAKDKMTEPGYQTLLKAQIPQLDLENNAGQLRVIAGEFSGHQGPAHTFSPLDVWDMKLNAGKTTNFTLPAGRNAILVVLKGAVEVNGQKLLHDAELALFSVEGESVTLTAHSDSVALLLSGAPLDEPIVGYGPFVMNSQQQIVQALSDFQTGHFGRMTIQ